MSIIFRASSYKQQSKCDFMIVSQQRGKVKVVVANRQATKEAKVY